MSQHSHGHGHHQHTEDVDWAAAGAHLLASAARDAAWYRTVAETLTRPTDRLILDVGCGGAGAAAAFAEHTDAQVIGLDAAPELVAAARAAHPAVDFAVADLADPRTLRDAIGDKGADLIWASGMVHHLPDQQAAVDALAGLLRPGGRLALAEGGLRVNNLPWDVGVGRPGLQLRLTAATEEWFTRMRASIEGAVRMPYGWTEALRRAGLTDVTTRSHLVEVPPPLPPEERKRVAASLGFHLDRLAELLDEDDRGAWDRLLDEGDPAWLGHREDLFVLDVRSVHVGMSPQAAAG